MKTKDLKVGMYVQLTGRSNDRVVVLGTGWRATKSYRGASFRNDGKDVAIARPWVNWSDGNRLVTWRPDVVKAFQIECTVEESDRRKAVAADAQATRKAEIAQANADVKAYRAETEARLTALGVTGFITWGDQYGGILSRQIRLDATQTATLLAAAEA